MINTIRFALRQLRKNPTFTVVAVLSLAVGIGSTSGMFSVADALLLRPIPVPQSGDVLNVENYSKAEAHQGMSWQDFRDYRARNHSFTSLVAFTDTSIGYKRQADGLAHLTSGLLVSGTFFQDLRVKPIAGRTFRENENAVPGRDAVVILSHEFWVREFESNPNAVGQRIRLNGVEFTIVGVAPPTFTGMDQFNRPQLFVPLAMAGTLGDDKLWPDRADRALEVKGRLIPGITIPRAEADLTGVAHQLAKAYPQSDAFENVRVNTELQARMDDSPSDTTIVITLMALSLCVLLVACANVAGLLMSRARARTKEVAVRLAVGANRRQLVAQLLLESLLVALMGAAGGMFIAYGTVQYFATLIIPSDLPIGPVFETDIRMLLFALAISLLSTIVFGLLPALQNTKVDLIPSLKAADADSRGKQKIWGRNGLVVGQVGVSMALLVVAAIMYQGFTLLLDAGPGFRTDHILLMSFNPGLVRDTPEQTQAFYRRLLDETVRVPGVQAATLSHVVPMATMQHSESFLPEGYQLTPGQDSIPLMGNIVGPDYFKVMAIPILSGRAFSKFDTATTPKVAIVNEVIANKYFKGKDPLGKRIRLGGKTGGWAQIVGVARTSKVLWVGEPPQEFLYLPYEQNPKPAMNLFVQASGDPSELADPIRKVIARIDSSQPVFDVRTLAYFYHARAVVTAHIVLNCIAALGGMGLFLSMVGLYGVVAFSIGRRKREIGLRMAIGADKAKVIEMVLKQGAILGGFGVLAGVLLSLGARPLVNDLLVGAAKGSDALIVGAVGLLMMAVTLLAVFGPARRAAAIDPIRALRDE